MLDTPVCCWLLQDIAAAIDAAGACHISFNPITKPNIEKALKHIVAEVGLQLPAQLLTGIADSADGDLRNAVETLQLAAAGMPIDKASRNQKSKVIITLCDTPVCPKLLMNSCVPKLGFIRSKVLCDKNPVNAGQPDL